MSAHGKEILQCSLPSRRLRQQEEQVLGARVMIDLLNARAELLARGGVGILRYYG
jgi:hypothetical protein